MPKEILINPVTRIEGHSKITIKLDDQGEVEDAQFRVTQFRGFEKFCEGRPFTEMPSLTARTCGICPVSHLMASAKACDKLRKIHESSQLRCARRNFYGKKRVERFGRSHQMALLANPAGARGKRWHLCKRASLAKFFEAAKLGDMKLGILHLTLVIQFDGDFRMALDACDRIDQDLFRHCLLCSESGFVGQVGHASGQKLS